MDILSEYNCNQSKLLSNHGSITVGENVAVAFDHTYYLERAAMVQVEAIKCSKSRQGF